MDKDGVSQVPDQPRAGLTGAQWPQQRDPQRFMEVLDGRMLLRCGCQHSIDTVYLAHLMPGAQFRCRVHGLTTITWKNRSRYAE